MSARLAAAPDRSRADFLAFVKARPDEERWELIDGARVMQASPRLVHQIITMNIATLFNAALERSGSAWLAIPGFMVDLTASSPDNMYMPDLLVIDPDEGAFGQNTTERCLVAVEVVSPSDMRRSGKLGGRRRIDVKVERYRMLPSCSAILVVAQDRIDLRLLTRAGGGWIDRSLTDPEDTVHVEAVGLTCRLRDLYRRTPLSGPTSG